MVAKESERYDANSKQSTAYFQGYANITVYSTTVINQEKTGGDEKKKEYHQVISYI